jgi:hypothetical protein
MALLIHAFLRVTFDTAELTGCAWSAADALRLRDLLAELPNALFCNGQLAR